jgi:hypothetical protein
MMLTATKAGGDERAFPVPAERPSAIYLVFTRNDPAHAPCVFMAHSREDAVAWARAHGGAVYRYVRGPQGEYGDETFIAEFWSHGKPPCKQRLAFFAL